MLLLWAGQGLWGQWDRAGTLLACDNITSAVKRQGGDCWQWGSSHGGSLVFCLVFHQPSYLPICAGFAAPSYAPLKLTTGFGKESVSPSSHLKHATSPLPSLPLLSTGFAAPSYAPMKLTTGYGKETTSPSSHLTHVTSPPPPHRLCSPELRPDEADDRLWQGGCVTLLTSPLSTFRPFT